MQYKITEKPKKYKREYNVYKIINSVDDKVYVGSTTTELWHRMSQHRNDAKKGEKSKLYDLMREYGIENFKIVLIRKANEKNIRKIEEEEINKLDPKIRLNKRLSCKKDSSFHYDYEKISELYKQTKSYNKTSKIIGCSRPTVKKAVERCL